MTPQFPLPTTLSQPTTRSTIELLLARLLLSQLLTIILVQICREKMPSVRNFALGLLAAAAVATASDVVQLKKDTFDEFVKANDIVLAECE